jgi:hypothetical protein
MTRPELNQERPLWVRSGPSATSGLRHKRTLVVEGMLRKTYRLARFIGHCGT